MRRWRPECRGDRRMSLQPRLSTVRRSSCLRAGSIRGSEAQYRLEDDGSFRQRAIDALTERPFGGNVADYKRVVLAIDGVGGLQVYPTWDGGGSVELR